MGLGTSTPFEPHHRGIPYDLYGGGRERTRATNRVVRGPGASVRWFAGSVSFGSLCNRVPPKRARPWREGISGTRPPVYEATPAGRGRCEPDRRGLLDFEDDDPLQLLRMVSTNVAIAWDDDLTHRRPNLDPDNFAAEAIRTERAGLTLVSDLDLVLETLACAFHRTGQVANPLFVLPVDDCDMNPAAVLKMLRHCACSPCPDCFFWC